MRIATMAAMTLLSAGVTASAADAQTCGGQWLPGYGVPGVDGSVNCMTLWDPDGPGPLPESLVIGGTFSIVHTTPAKNLAMWDGNQWTELGGGTNGRVQQLCVYNGDLYMRGTFTAAGGTAVGPLASWNGTTWSGLEGAATSVTAMQVYDGTLVVAGGVHVSGSGAPIAKWNGNAWSFLGPGSTIRGGAVQAMTVHDGKLIAAGKFTSVGDKVAGGIAAWDGAWTPMGTGVAATSEIRALCVYGDQLYAGGTFAEIGGVPARALGRWTGTTWEATGLPVPSGPFSPASSVRVLTVFDGKLVATGSQLNSVFSTWDGNAWGALDQHGGVTALSLQPFRGSLFAGTAGSNSVGLGLVELVDGRWKPIGIGFDGSKASLELFQGQLIHGGQPGNTLGNELGPVAAWNGAVWTSVGTPPEYVSSGSRMLTIGQRLYVEAGLSRLASWDGVGWALTPSLNFFTRISSLSRYKSEVLVVGDIRLPGQFDTTGVAAWTGDSWKSLGTDLTNPAIEAVEFGGDLVVAGDFGRGLASDPAARGPFRFDGTKWRGWPIGLVSGSLLAVHNGKLLIASTGSDFVRSVDGTTYGVIAQWEGDHWRRLASSEFPGFIQIVDMTTYKGDLVVAGRFTKIDGVAANSIARWNGAEWKALGSGLAEGLVVNVQQFGDELVATGSFRTAGGSMSVYFARWTDDPKPWLAVQPQSTPVNELHTLRLKAAAASGYVNVSYQWKRNGVAVQDGPAGASVGGGLVSGAAGALASPSDGGDVVLRIEGVQASDAGVYTVEFSNACNTTASWAAAVSVNTCPGDLNTDGFVGDDDFNLFAAAYDTMLCDDPAMPIGCLSDWNGDGLVDDRDFQRFVVAYGAMVCD